jgi:ATP-dependent DNA helicase RecG
VTATPIPRTLAMTQFSHFDASIIDQLPAGRKPIHTAVMPQDRRDEIIDRLQKVLDQGGQIYWVCTRIEEDEQDELLATEALLKYLIEQLPHAKIASVHGQLKGVEKDRIMTAFKQGEFNILVATTVIEVGVDVPNANIMIIENAERLGLSQLHQLRGRVGRGTEEAYCILMYNQPLSETTQKRLHIIRHSTDGFYLAEQDLLIRGAGDMFGTRQTGFMEFRLAQIPQHLELLKQAQHHAHQILVNHSPVAETLLSYWYPDSQKYLNA